MIVSTSLLKVIWEETLAAYERSAAQAPTSTVRRNIVHLRLPSSIRLQMRSEPLTRQTGDFLESPRLLEKMRSARNDFQALFDTKMLECIAVHLDDGNVRAAYDQQCRTLHAIEYRDGEVRTPAARYHCAHVIRSFCRSRQGRRCAGTGAEISDGKVRRRRVPGQPVGGAHHARGQQSDIEPQSGGASIFALLRRREQIH